MKSGNYPPRLAVVAALVHGEDPGSGPVASAARTGDLSESADPLAASSANTQERALARALRGGQNSAEPAQGDPAIADLLYLADDCPGAGKLAVGLSQAFLLPDDSAPGVSGEHRRPVFAELYRQFVLPELRSQAKVKAAARLRDLDPQHPGRE